MLKITDIQVKLIVWALGLASVTFLIAIGKLPAEALKYALMYAAGTLGGSLKLPGMVNGGDPAGAGQNASGGQPGGTNGNS